jgi:hypothetical protein
VPVDARRLIPPNYTIITRKMCHRGPSAGLSSDFHTAWVESECDAVALGRTYLFPPLSSGGALAAIMHEVAHFCRSVERACGGGPTRWIGVMPLAVRRV